MKKIAIITLNGYYNYGNRLQNYALQEVLKTYGFNVETILIKSKKENTIAPPLRQKIYNILKSLFKNTKKGIWLLTHKRERLISEELRTKKFKDFTLKYIVEKDLNLSFDNVPANLSDMYDFFVAGSDQVWNPDFNNISPIYFLTFADAHKRLAYAPSFGISQLKENVSEKYKIWLNEFNKLSVRENDGAKLIKELTGREASVLADPTMLLSKEKWLEIAASSEKIEKKYLLTYFLGEISKSDKKQINDIAKKNNLKIINLVDIREKSIYRTGPSEFVEYINSCSILCTDSFHGMIFAILLEKPFIAYKRAGAWTAMYSRVTTLLDKFNLDCRKSENIVINDQLFNVDYSHIPPVLDSERKKAFDYLNSCFLEEN